MNLNGVEYYYIRNGQSDIIGLFDKTGAQVVSYTYDTWGKLISIKDGSGADITNNISSVGYKNPYRYRGYRYDTETGLYYLQSRYYNPDWGRFINADAIVGQTGDLLSTNMFAYCENTPSNGYDADGFRMVMDPDSSVGVYNYNNWAAQQERISASSKTVGKQIVNTSKNNNIARASLAPEGEANSKAKLYNEDGSVKQQRVYGPDGKALLDTDWNHGGVGHVFPHTHGWKDGKRDKDGVPFQGPPPPPEVVSNTRINGWAVAGVVLYWAISEGSRIVFPPRNFVPIP